MSSFSRQESVDDGVDVELLEHALTAEQRRIYDAYANAFKIIHSHLEQALQSTGTGTGGADGIGA